MTKLAAFIQVPFRSANQFLGVGGLQVLQVREPLLSVSPTAHLHLQKLHVQIDVIGSQNIQTDTGRLATGVAKERKLSQTICAPCRRRSRHFYFQEHAAAGHC
jgi:hypothetical protein